MAYFPDKQAVKTELQETINKFDLTLNDRREDMIKLNLSFCKPGCSFEGVNVETKEVLCFCKDYINTENKSMSDGFTEGFIKKRKNKRTAFVDQRSKRCIINVCHCLVPFF